MKTFATALQKGGTGKTSVALALAYQLQKKNKVIVIDADPQGNATSALIGDCRYELADYLLGDCSLIDAISQTRYDNLCIMPTKAVSGTKIVSKLRRYKKNYAADEPYAIKDLVSALATQFDYCIIDTSPAFDPFEENIFYACDDVIPVLQLDVFSNDGFSTFIKSLDDFKSRKRSENPTAKLVCLNAYNSSLTLNKLILDLWSKQTMPYVVIPTDQAFKRGQLDKKSMQECQPRKQTADAIEKIAELIGA